MGEILRVKLFLVISSILIALLALTEYYARWEQERNALNSRFTRTRFYVTHVLDPTVDGYRFDSWTRQEWLAWLNQRDILRRKLYPARKDSLQQKGLNSVVIATPSQVIGAFEGERHPYNPANNEQSNLFWSETLFHSFVFERTGSTLRVFQCPPMYIAVGMDKKFPVHLHEHSRRREMKSYRVKVKKDCIEIM